MQKYLLVSKLALQDLFEYKIDFFLQTVKYVFMVISMALVWIAVEQSGHAGLLTTKETVSYFIFAAMFYTLSNFHPWYVENDIQFGTLSKYLVKPLSPTLYYFFFQFSKTMVETILKFLVFIIILFSFDLLPISLGWKILFLIFYCPLVFAFSFQWLSLISLSAFWITEAHGVRWAVTIFTRLLSGILVPLFYFPTVAQQILYYLPFEHLAFTPIQFLLGKSDVQGVLYSTLILIFWTVIITIFRQYILRIGLNNYEGVGI